MRELFDPKNRKFVLVVAVISGCVLFYARDRPLHEWLLTIPYYLFLGYIFFSSAPNKDE